MRLSGRCFARCPRARYSPAQSFRTGATRHLQHPLLVRYLSHQNRRCSTIFTTAERLLDKPWKTTSVAKSRSVSTTSVVPDDVAWEEILADAFMYGIRSKKQLLFEADVGHMKDRGSRLVDEPPGRQNIELWLILLRAQALHHGHDGIKAIWKGLKTRGKMVKLHQGNSRVDALWDIFLAAGSADLEFLWTICKEARRSKFDRPALFAEIVGAALESDAPLRAKDFAFYLSEIFRGHDDLVGAFLKASRSKHTLALRAFCNIYEIVPQSSIYSSVVPLLWQQSRAADAIFMHSFLLSKGDLPPQFELLEPFIHHGVLHNASQSSFINVLKASGASFEGQIRRLWSIEKSRITGLSPESLNIVASKTLGVQPRKFSDKFVARMFATRSISFEFAVNSMRILGLIETGPLAVREMALSSPDLETLQARFELFRKLEIDTGSSVFVRTIQNACEAGQWAIVQSMANSDLHHDAFADQDVQRRLLAVYYRSRDWLQVNRTVAVLTLGRFDDTAREKAANMLLQAMLVSDDYHGAIRLMSDMRYQGWKVVGYQISRLTILKLRQECRQPFSLRIKARVDKLTLLIGFLQDLMASGASVGLKAWWLPLNALGRLGRFEALEKLAIWLAEWYRPKGLHYEYFKQPLPPRLSNLNTLFSTKFQQTLVCWCFRPQKGQTTVSAEQSIRWAPILNKLRERYGVSINEQVIKWMYIRRLRMVFSISPYPFTLSRNRQIRARNHNPLWRYWQLYNVNWRMSPTCNSDAEMEAVIRGLYAPGRQEKRYQARRQSGLTFEDTIGAAEIRAALVAKDKRRGSGQIEAHSNSGQSTVTYGRIL